jgi:hypothetical protein
MDDAVATLRVMAYRNFCDQEFPFKRVHSTREAYVHQKSHHDAVVHHEPTETPTMITQIKDVLIESWSNYGDLLRG